MTDPVIVDAENTLMLYSRFMREIPSPAVPRHWVDQLLATLAAVLDAHAELVVGTEPPYPDDDMEYVEADPNEDWPPEELDYNETYDEGEPN